MPPPQYDGDNWEFPPSDNHHESAAHSSHIPDRMSGFAGDEGPDAAYSRVMSYPDEVDYYALLGVSRDSTDADIRSAHRSLTLSFHPDKQPAHLHEAAERYFDQIRNAYETLIDPKKRVVYDLLGAEGVQQEWRTGGSMSQRGELGVRAMSPQEFRRWFLESMKSRERKVVDSMVRSRGSIALGIDASSLISVDEEEGDIYFHIPSIEASSYAVGYNFRTPLPIPESLFGEGKVDEDSEAEKPEGNAQPGASSTEMVISTRVAGKLQKVQQEVVDENTDTTYLVQLPRILTATGVSIGAAVSHVFGDVAGAKGIFKRRPFSFLHNSAVTAQASLLPEPSLETGVTKSIQLVPGTRPFNVNLTTTFTESILHTLPLIGLQVTKHVSATKLALCSWSSGTLSWPHVIQRLVEPFFGLGLEEGDALAAQSSSLQFAFISLPKSHKVIDEEDDGDDEEAEEEELIHERQRVKSESEKAESWNVQMQATPEGGALSFTYGRNVFSGKTVDDVVRSEWSSEGYFPVPPENESRAIRLEVQTTLGLNLDFGWHIRAIRQVGEFTRMGLGVGVQGPRGLVMTVYWNRLGQRIQLPVAICPAEVVNAEAATVAVVFPWLAYCALEFGFIRPRERKKRRLMMYRRHKQLKKQIPRKKAESLQAIELMTPQVQHRQAREEKHAGLVINKAEYGYIPSEKRKNRDGVAESQVIDVTVPVAAMVDQGQLVIPKRMTKFKILGFYDPAPLLPKKLKIWYSYHGGEHFVEATDSEGLTCPMRGHLCL